MTSPRRAPPDTVVFNDIAYGKAGRVAHITITRPRYDSALTGDTLEEMALAAEGAGAADEVGAGVAAVTGAGS